MNKRLWAALLILTMGTGLLSGCKSESPQEEALAGQIVQDQEQENQSGQQSSPEQSTEQEQNSEDQSDEQATEKEEQSEEQPGNDADDEKQEEQPAGTSDETTQKQSGSDTETQESIEQPQEETTEETPSADSDTEKGDSEESGKETAEPDAEESTTAPLEEELVNLYQSSVLSTAIAYTGKTAKNSRYTVSKPIDVQAGDSVTFGPMASAQVVMGYTYDKSGNPLQIINGHTVKETAEFLGGMKLYTYTVPADGATVKFSVHNDSKNDFVVARNHSFDLKEYAQLSGILPDYVDDALKNKDGLFVGDSICIATRDERMDGVKGWARRIADEYGMNAVNNGKSGVSVSNKRSQGTVLTQLLEKKTQDFDYVVLQGGVNDAWSSVDIGVMEDGFDPTEFDPSTFAGGLELLIYNSILYYGETASIGYLFTFNTPAFSKGRISEMAEYYAVAKKICEKWGITYFDMYNHEQITKELKMDTLTHTTDYIHPSSSGYDILSPYIADYMKTMLPCKQEILEKVLEGK